MNNLVSIIGPCIHMCHLEYARLEVSIGVCLFTARQCLDNNLIRIGMFIISNVTVLTHISTVLRLLEDGHVMFFIL